MTDQRTNQPVNRPLQMGFNPCRLELVLFRLVPGRQRFVEDSNVPKRYAGILWQAKNTLHVPSNFAQVPLLNHEEVVSLEICNQQTHTSLPVLRHPGGCCTPGTEC